MADQELPGGWLPPQAPGEPRPPVEVPPEVQAGPLGLVALVCAVLSIGLLVFSLGLSFVLSLPLAVTGWVCAVRAPRPGVGRTLSIIALVLSVAATVVWVALMAGGVSPEDLQRSLEQELERQRRSS
jgi:hypothetical protein